MTILSVPAQLYCISNKHFYCLNVAFLLYLALGFLQGVRSEFTDDISETAVGPIFTGHG